MARFDLTAVEIQDLSDHLKADATHIRPREEPQDDENSGLRPPILNELVVFGLRHFSVLLPTAGAVGKSALDVLVDRVKKWLDTRPEEKYRKVGILGPDGQVVLIVKTGEEIETSSKSISEP